MAKNVASQALLKPQASHRRNAFNLDNRHVYSQKAGQIVPVKCFHYEPGTYLDIQAHDFTMTFPMQTAPFLRGRKEFAFYSVYYNAVWSLFNQYQGTRDDPKTSAFGQSPFLVEPRIYLDDIYSGIFSQFLYYFVYEHFIPFKVNTLDAATYPNISANKEDVIRSFREQFLAVVLSTEYDEGSESCTPFQFNFTCTYGLNNVESVVINFNFTVPYHYDSLNMMLDRYFREDEESRIFTDGQVSDWFLDILGHVRVFNWIRKLDMLGYGNLYPFFRKLENDLITILDDSSVSTINRQVNMFSRLHSAYTALILTVVSNPSSSFENWNRKAVNLYPICAYNAVFYHFFRNTYYDTMYYVHNYNLDFVSVETSFGQFNVVGLRHFSTRFLDIEYHQWKKDTFTAVLPDQQFGAVSSLSLNVSGSLSFDGASASLNQNILSVNTDGSLRRGSLSTTSSYGNFNSLGSINPSLNVVSSFDVIALKRAEMLQEYRQQLMRAGNRTSDVFRALYGKSPSSEHEDDVIPRFLETFGEDIFVDPVQSTANTGDSNPNGQLGDIAARGKFRGDSPHVKFNAGGNFGLILCVSYVVPTAEYNSYMFDKHIFELTPEDHFIPQFENLGLEPIYSDELNSLSYASNMRVLGFAPRYHHKKQEVDLVHGAFVSWYYDSDRPLSLSLGGYTLFGDFNNWVSPRTDMQNRGVTTIRDFYINPSVLDNIFVRAAGADFADDQFICNTFFEVNATKEMSVIGLVDFV